SRLSPAGGAVSKSPQEVGGEVIGQELARAGRAGATGQGSPTHPRRRLLRGPWWCRGAASRGGRRYADSSSRASSPGERADHRFNETERAQRGATATTPHGSLCVGVADQAIHRR